MRVEVAPSGRAQCRGCKKKIDKGALRFAESYKIPGTDQEALRYHHMMCAAAVLGPQLREAMAVYEGEIPDRAEIEKAIDAPPPAPKGGAEGAKYPRAERAPTGRARCMQCSEAIEKGAWRVAVERELEAGAFVRKSAGYMHPACAPAWAEANEPGDYGAWIEALLANGALEAGDAAEVRELVSVG